MYTVFVFVGKYFFRVISRVDLLGQKSCTFNILIVIAAQLSVKVDNAHSHQHACLKTYLCQLWILSFSMRRISFSFFKKHSFHHMIDTIFIFLSP